MPDAICKTCGRTTYWRAQRGAKLANFKCKCGGDLRRRPIERKKVECTTGRCALCGRRRQAPGGGLLLPRSTRFELFRHGDKQAFKIEILPAGTMVCWSHSTDYPVFVAE